MPSTPSLWYPHLAAARWRSSLLITALGAIVAGSYGAVHDQVSFTIAPEYFTRLKFQQFAWADLGWPTRAYVALIGFLATWWVGLIAGWVLARLGLAELWEMRGWRPVVRAFGVMLLVAVVVGLGGALVGVAVTSSGDLSHWDDWRIARNLHDVRSFVIVAYLHAGSYLGGIVGLIVAGAAVRKMRNHPCPGQP
jgi:hypothetical protein